MRMHKVLRGSIRNPTDLHETTRKTLEDAQGTTLIHKDPHESIRILKDPRDGVYLMKLVILNF